MVRLFAHQHPFLHAASPYTREQYRWVAARLDRLTYLRILPAAYALIGIGAATIAWFIVLATEQLPGGRIYLLILLLGALVALTTICMADWARTERNEECAVFLTSLRVRPELRAVTDDVLAVIPWTARLLRPLLHDPRVE